MTASIVTTKKAIWNTPHLLIFFALPSSVKGVICLKRNDCANSYALSKIQVLILSERLLLATNTSWLSVPITK
jgi:hypothetical protein